MNLNSYIRERSAEELTAPELLAAYTADERNWQNLPAKTINRWFSSKGREEDLATFAATINKSTDSEQLYELKGAIKTLIRSLSLSDTSISLQPGHKDRQLIDSLPSLSQVPESGLSITANDIKELIDAAYLGETVTEADVKAALARIARQTAADEATLACQAAFDLSRQINQASIDDADVSPVTLQTPAVPDGYSVVNGTLAKDA